MLSPSQFREYLASERSAGKSLAKIGDSLGVTKQAVFQWLSGANDPSRAVLMLAHRLQREQAGSWPGIDL